MDHRLSVLVQIDLQGTSVRLVVTGRLTQSNQHALHAAVTRARMLVPLAIVTVDLACAHHVETAAVDLLRWALEQSETTKATGPVKVLLPAPGPQHSVSAQGQAPRPQRPRGLVT